MLKSTRKNSTSYSMVEIGISSIRVAAKTLLTALRTLLRSVVEASKSRKVVKAVTEEMPAEVKSQRDLAR